jgi:Carboxypeptidase regulatory-like domain
MSFPRGLSLAALSLAALTAAGQAPARIEGRVLTTSGDPAPGAALQLSLIAGPPPPISSTAGGDGSFLLDRIPPGRYTLSAHKNGFLTQDYNTGRSDSPAGATIALAAGQEVKDLVIRLTPAGVITGRVIDPEGDPMAQAQVTAYRATYLGGRQRFAVAANARSDDQGNFRLANLRPGRYLLKTERPLPAGRSAATSAYVATFYPSELTPQAASTVTLTPGAELRSIDIRVRRERVYAIRGRAVDAATGMPAIDARLELAPEQGLSGTTPQELVSGRAITQLPDAAFEYQGLPAGTYVLTAVPGGGTLGQDGTMVVPNYSGRVEVTIAGADVDNVVLPVGPGVEIAGRVTMENGSSAAMPRVVRLTQVSGFGMNPPYSQIPADGNFRLEHVPLGQYAVKIEPLPEGAYVKSVRFQSSDVTHGLLDVSANGTLEILLSAKSASVSGTVPGPGITVTVWPKTPDAGGSAEAVRTVVSDPEGRFELAGLAPGRYYLAAWEQIRPDLIQNVGFLTGFASDASNVTLEEGVHQTIDPAPISREKADTAASRMP